MATTRKARSSARTTGRAARDVNDHNPAPKGQKFRDTKDIEGEGRWVHAYRRLPHMDKDGKAELPVEVVCFGERIHFRSNAEGHIVAEVKTPDAYDRLTKEIPEMYIPYDQGKNVPEAGDLLNAAPVVKGKYVLVNGEETMVLDKMTDEQVRAFASEAGLEDEQLPDVLKDETLKQAVVNLLTSE